MRDPSEEPTGDFHAFSPTSSRAQNWDCRVESNWVEVPVVQWVLLETIFLWARLAPIFRMHILHLLALHNG